MSSMKSKGVGHIPEHWPLGSRLMVRGYFDPKVRYFGIVVEVCFQIDSDDKVLYRLNGHERYWKSEDIVGCYRENDDGTLEGELEGSERGSGV